MKILIWNVEWAKPNSNREKIIKGIIENASPDIICITEGYLSSWEEFGHVISSKEDYGYKITDGRRKVILISKEPWENVDDLGDETIPSGRFISARTYDMDIIGVCIPWKDAHVNTGRKDKEAWEDHLSYLKGLQKVLSSKNDKTLVMGDFNQRVPRKYSRQDVFDLLIETFRDYTIETSSLIQPIEKLSIDHLCTKNIVDSTTITSIDNIQDDVKLSDHFGLIIDL